MLDPVKAWHEEHMYFRHLLRLLQEQVDRLHTGETPAYALMLDIIGYLREWGDQVHHPREDEAFRRLVARRPDRELPVARLAQEHRVIGNAGDQLRALLEEVVADGVVSLAEIEVAAATYLVYFGNHIAREEEEILPLAARTLDADDWAAIRTAAPAAKDPLFGDRPHERYRALRHRIEMEAAALA